MKNINRSIAITFILLTFILSSCSSEDAKYIPPTLVSFPETGLLGQPVKIQIENFQVDKLQVFFDLEKAQVNYISDKEIMVMVPRTIKTNNPTLKIIDLNENKTILEKAFSLKKPVIRSYNSDNVNFNETFIINGENFDILKDFVSVTVNDKIATIINVAYDKIEIQIPNEITTPELQVKVRTQLQETTSTLPLHLKKPVITGIQNSVAWIGTELKVYGQNFNPNFKFGEVYINGILCYFSSTNNELSVSIPPGPYQDFKITNVTYKTAGFSYSYDCDIPIRNDALMVDYMDSGNITHTIFECNGKAYAFQSVEEGVYDFDYDYKLLEFSPITEKWTELSTFKYKGYLADVVYDGNNTVYLYKKSQAKQEFSLTKLNLNTFEEVAINLPFGNKIFNPILFAYRDNLYMLSGLNIIDSNVTVRNQKYKYSDSTNSWSVLPDSAFSSLPLVSSSGTGKCQYLFSGNDIYISIFSNFRSTYKITPDLNVTEYRLYSFCFDYANAIIGKQINYNDYLFNINTNVSKPIDNYSLFGYSESFFTLNKEIYYLRNSWTGYYQNKIYTQKLRKEILNGLF